MHKFRIYHYVEQGNHILYLGAVAFSHHGIHIMAAGSLALILCINLVVTILAELVGKDA